MKQTGILMPVFSLPSSWGVGELGSAAYQWVDLLAKHHVTIWQILPVNPTGYGNSPYQPYSSCAGDEIFISLERLFEDGLLKELPPSFQENTDRVRYDEVRVWKETYLKHACKVFYDSRKENGEGKETASYAEFISQSWVYPYAVFRMFKKANDGRCWNEWPVQQKNWPEQRGKEDADTAFSSEQQEEIRYQMFLQYEFFCQWMRLKEYAAGKQVSIMGDIPFYVGVDSVDVWADKKNFLLDAEGKPVFIAGVPPDYFSATGQRWGNPIYDWEYMKKEGYQFWIDRIGYNQKLFDLIRIDHFRAFDTYWKIPASCPTAVEGDWIEAPGYEVLDTIIDRLPGIHLVAEDLGELRPEVGVLKEHYHLMGMKILQFNIDTDGKYGYDRFCKTPEEEGKPLHLIVYTGTHDNATTKEWYESLTVSARRKVRKWLKRTGFTQGSVVHRLVECTLADRAEYAVIPAADFLELGAFARLNTPGTVGSPNWEWRMGGSTGQCMKEMDRALVQFDRQILQRSAD